MDMLSAIEQATTLARETPGREFAIIEREWIGPGCFVAEKRSIYKGDHVRMIVIGAKDPITGEVKAERQG